MSLYKYKSIERKSERTSGLQSVSLSSVREKETMRKQASLSTFFATKRESSPTEDTTTDWNSVVPESQKNNFKAFAYQTTSNKPSGGSGEKVRIYAPTTSSSSVDLTQNEDFSAKRVISKTRGEEDVNNTVVAPASKKPRVLPGSITKPSSVPSSSSYRNSGPGYGNIVGAKTSYASSFKPPKSTTSYGDIPSDDDDNVKNKPLKIDEKNPLLQQMYKLSFSQKQVLEVIMSRKSVFFTGAAGTGKSYILKILQDVMGVLDMSTKISFTAPTGVAACNIQGLTIHSWSGAGMASEPIDKLLPIVLRSRAAVERWRNTEILVIDEISMMSAELLDKLDIIGRRVRNDLRPFGGIQLVLCGDFFQLPPVGLGKSCKFCFESNVWKELFEQDNNMILLEKVFRQKDDHVFLNLLNELRYGFMSPSTLRVLSDKSQRDEANTEVVTDIRPTKLFSTNQEVDKYNTYEMDLLCQGDQDEASRYFKAFDDGKDPYLNQLRGGTKAPVDLYLKKGAQVMLLKNLSTSRGLVNGARGTVIGFEPSNGRSEYYPFLPRVKFCVVLGQEKLEEVVTLPHEAWEIKQGDK